MAHEELKAKAVAMIDKAYCPYSNFPVGAALECMNGNVYTGCNVENAVFPAGTCAERNAIFHAVSAGERWFRRIVVAGKSEDFCVPCGVCRQVMREFNPDMEVICLNGHGEEKVFTLQELLPHSFGPDHLTEKVD